MNWLRTHLKYLNFFGMGFALSVAWNGVKEFDHATQLLPFIRGLFWLILGVGAFWVFYFRFKGGEDA